MVWFIVVWSRTRVEPDGVVLFDGAGLDLEMSCNVVFLVDHSLVSLNECSRDVYVPRELTMPNNFNSAGLSPRVSSAGHRWSAANMLCAARLCWSVAVLYTNANR